MLRSVEQALASLLFENPAVATGMKRWHSDDLPMIAARSAALLGRALDLAQSEAFWLGGLEVRPPTREVIGENISLVLEPRVMQVLVSLAARRGTVVSRADLVDECWAGRAVSDDAINRCIQALRRLAESSGAFSIRTVARVGYRLEESASAAPARSAEDWDALSSPRPTVRIPTSSERRHLTLLACGADFRGSAELDPEARYDIAAQWREIVVSAARSFGAHVDTARGDHVLACFGYPKAQENAAERAVRAGLAIMEKMPALNTRLWDIHGVCLSVRAAVHAGTALVARVGDRGVELFGEVLDLVRKVEASVPANAVTITGTVIDMLPNQLAASVAGSIEGPAGEPILLHRVHAGNGAVGRSRPTGSHDFVGREEELSLLVSRWARVGHGAGQLVVVHGEPGIGKTCLVEAFRENITGDAHLWIDCRGEPLSSGAALHAASQMLCQAMGWRGGESQDEKLQALEKALERSGLKLAEAVPLVADMLGLPAPARYSPLLLAPEQRRRRLLATLVEWIFSVARSQPLVLVVEDLHWLDPSSLELLHRLAEQGSGLPLLLLCTARPEFRASWPVRAHHMHVALDGLGQSDMRCLVNGLAGMDALEPHVVEAIVARADGVPLFAEALVRLVDGQHGTADIPATLMDSLAARLDRLGDVRVVAHMAAVIGRSFSWDLLRAVAPLADEELHAAMEQLGEAGLIETGGTAADARYRFRHALIRDAAYGQVPGTMRRAWHRQVAEAMARGVETRGLEELAHHWTLAGEAERAIAAWAEAGAGAYGRHALAEASQAYRQALSVLATQPDTSARDARELDLSAALLLALIPDGPTTGEMEAIAARNQELAERIGQLPVLVQARTYAFVAATFRSEWGRAARLAEQVSVLGYDGSAVVPPEIVALARALGHFCCFTVAFYRGDYSAAEIEFRAWETLSCDRRPQQRAIIVMALGNAAILAWHLGDTEEAERRVAAARAYADAENNPFDRASWLMITGLLAVFRRDTASVERLSGEAHALAREHGFVQIEGWSGASLGWARAQLGTPSEGAALIRSSLLLLARTDTRVSLPLFLTLLGEAQALKGDKEAALENFEEALTISPPEGQYRPIALISRGELEARTGEIARAEASFREAIATAELMGAVACKQRALRKLGELHSA